MLPPFFMTLFSIFTLAETTSARTKTRDEIKSYHWVGRGKRLKESWRKWKIEKMSNFLWEAVIILVLANMFDCHCIIQFFRLAVINPWLLLEGSVQMAEVGVTDINTSNKELLFELLNSVSYIVQNKYIHTLTLTLIYT